MLIKTKEFEIQRTEYFQYLIKHWVRLRWIIYLVFLFMIFLIYCRYDWGWKLFWTFAIFYPGYLLLICWAISSPRDNQMFYAKKTFTFDDEFIRMNLVDGSSSQIKWENVVKVVRQEGNYLLYLGKRQFFLLPLRVLESEKDLEQLNQFLRTKNLIK